MQMLQMSDAISAAVC